MKRIVLLLLAVVCAPTCAGEARESFDERVMLAKEAENDERFHPYPSMMNRKAGREFARAFRQCRISTSKPDTKPFVLVADIHADGRARDVAVRPAHAAARCFAAGVSSIAYLPPPSYPGREGFPMTMRVGSGR